MNEKRESAKLAELREKTDRDLVKMVASRIERGLRAESEVRREQAYDEATMLLHAVPGLPQVDRSVLEARLAELRLSLGSVQQGGLAA